MDGLAFLNYSNKVRENNMNTSLNEAFEEHLRKCKIYKNLIPKFRTELLIKKTNPKTTMQVYFQTLQLNDYVKGFIEVREEFIKLYTFGDLFQSQNFLPVNSLWLFVDNIKTNQNNFVHLIDSSFMNSKNQSLRLWDIDYEEVLNDWEKYIDIMIEKLENINDEWSTHYLNLFTNDSSVLVNGNGMELFKILSTPEENSMNLFDITMISFKVSGREIRNIKLNPDDIRTSLDFELFLSEELGTIYPECFL